MTIRTNRKLFTFGTQLGTQVYFYQLRNPKSRSCYWSKFEYY